MTGWSIVAIYVVMFFATLLISIKWPSKATKIGDYFCVFLFGMLYATLLFALGESSEALVWVLCAMILCVLMFVVYKWADASRGKA